MQHQVTDDTARDSAKTSVLRRGRNKSAGKSMLSRLSTFAQLIAMGILLIAIWQLIVFMELLPAILLPTPAATFEQLVMALDNIIHGGYVLGALWVTTQEIILAFCVAAGVGFISGLLVGETKLGARVVMPYIVGINVMPKVAFAPLFVAWLGFGLSAKVALGAFIGFFPMTVDTAAGISSTDRQLLAVFRAMRASRWQTLTKLKLPAAAPFMFAGLKSAGVFSVIGVIVVEYLTGGGIGELVNISAAQLRIDRLLAFVFLLSAVGLAVYKIIGAVERSVVRWQQPDQGFIERGAAA